MREIVKKRVKKRVRESKDSMRELKKRNYERVKKDIMRELRKI